MAHTSRAALSDGAGSAPQRARLRIRSGEELAEQARRQQAKDAARREAEVVRVGQLLRVICARYFGPGRPIPAADGWVFRELAEYCGCREDRVSQIAREIGLWPWNATEVEYAVARRRNRDRPALGRTEWDDD